MQLKGAACLIRLFVPGWTISEGRERAGAVQWGNEGAGLVHTASRGHGGSQEASPPARNGAQTGLRGETKEFAPTAGVSKCSESNCKVYGRALQEED